MLNTIIKSETRQKLLIKFFINIANTGYLNQLANEFSESTNSVRKELNNLTKAKFLIKKNFKNKILYQANVAHPLFYDIQNLVKKHLGIEQLIENVLKKIGDIDEIYLLGDYAKGVDSDQIDVLITGKNLNVNYISDVEKKLFKILKKKVVIINSNNSDLRVNKLLVFRN